MRRCTKASRREVSLRAVRTRQCIVTDLGVGFHGRLGPSETPREVVALWTNGRFSNDNLHDIRSGNSSQVCI